MSFYLCRVSVVKLTRATVAVLEAFLGAGADRALYGLEIMRATDLKSGTLYPILDRLETAGWISGAWEDIGDSNEGRPRRRYYSLTGEGVRAASAAMASRGPNARLRTRLA